MPVFTAVRIRSNEQGFPVVTDALTGAPIEHITSLEIFQCANRRMLAVIKQVCWVESIDATADAEVHTETVP